MKCQHGKNVVVVIELCSPPYWDDGIYFVNKNGNHGHTHLPLKGCKKCKAIRSLDR
jgi:hypothetical protein